MTAPGAIGAFGSNEVIDFRLERSRHEHFFGREDVLAELDRLVEKKPAGFVLVLGGPGMGKSALLSRWLDLREQRGEPTPHHFLRRSVNRWDEPDVVRANLAARIEALYPAQRDQDAPPERRLEELLARVSEQVLTSENKRLVLLLDGLDEASVRDERDNPVARILPYRLPRGVVVVCASRPAYPHLGWFEQREQLVRPPLDLDQPAWSASNDAAVRAFWAYHTAGGRFRPPLAGELAAAAIERAQGNLLHAVKLAEWLDDAPVEARTPANLPVGLEGLLAAIWRQLQALPTAQSECVRQGLGLLCVAREALPARCIEAALAWPHGTADAKLLETPARQVIVEEPAHWHQGEARYRLYHESFAEMVRSKLKGGLSDWHHRLAEQVAAWPPADAGDAFVRSYALRHGIAHRAEAARDEAAWRALERYCLDVGYLRGAAVGAGPLVLESALEQAAERCPVESVAHTLTDLGRALMRESHWLQHDPHALPGLLWNQLLGRCWSLERLHGEARWPRGEPSYRLSLPLQQADPSLRVIPSQSSVYTCAILPDGHRFVSGSRDGTLRVWDLASGRELQRLEGHEGAVFCCAVVPDGRRLVSGLSDGTLRVWDLASGRELQRLEGNGSSVDFCALVPDGRRLVSGSRDSTLRVWDLEEGRELQRLEGHEGAVFCCAVVPDGRRLVFGSRDGTLRVWDLESGRERMRLEGHGRGGILRCALVSDGRRLVSGSSDGTLRVWDLEEGRELQRLEVHRSGVNCCAVLPDGRRLVSGLSDGTLRVWDLASGRELQRLEGHGHEVLCCAVVPDGRRLVSGSLDGTLRVWDLEEGRELAQPEGNGSSAVACCALVPDGRRLVSGSRDGTLRVWDLASGRELQRLEVHRSGVNCCAVLPDGRRLVSGSFDGTLRVWDLESGRERMRLDGHELGVTCCALVSDGRRLVSGSYRDSLRVWDLEDGCELAQLWGHERGVFCCALLPDGRLVSGGGDGTLRVWDLERGRERMRLEGHGGGVTCCALVPDGRRLVSGAVDGTLRVWDLESGRELRRLDGHELRVNCCALLPDRRLVSGSGDRTLRVWDLETGRLEDTIYGAHGFYSLAVGNEVIVAGDAAGNVWLLTDRPFPQAPRGQFAPHPLSTPEPSTLVGKANARAEAAPCRLLFLASNPDAARRLDVGEELRSIQQDLESSPYGSLFEVKVGPAPRLDDVRKALTSLPTTIVHFSGHGAGTSGILFHEDAHGSRLVRTKALRDLFELAKGSVRLVVLNACYSAKQARAIVEVVDCVVGMTNAVSDEAACRFAPAFYRALASGRSVRNAVGWGRWAIEHGEGGGEAWRGRVFDDSLPTGDDSGDERAPQLLVREGVNADEIFFAPPSSS